jgi:hypothetical protein
MFASLTARTDPTHSQHAFWGSNNMTRNLAGFRFPTFLLSTSLLLACSPGDNVSAPASQGRTSLSISSPTITAVDLSNGVNGGEARTISSNGIILGEIGGSRGWWQSPSTSFTKVDDGNVQDGNRNADAGGGQGTAFLSTNGGAPWVSVALNSPAGVSAGMTIAHDLNASRVLVGNTLGSDVYAIEWPDPSAVPQRLPLPPLQYPASQSVARSINGNGTVVGYVLETLPHNGSRYEPLVWTADGVVSILPIPSGSTTALASNVNDNGIISGIVDGVHPIRWVPNAAGGYDVAVAAISVGRYNLDTGIDACGRITGGSDAGAWVWDGVSAPVILPSVAGPKYGAEGLDISESGTVVGISIVGQQKGRVLQRATMWTGLPAC